MKSNIMQRNSSSVHDLSFLVDGDAVCRGERRRRQKGLPSTEEKSIFFFFNGF